MSDKTPRLLIIIKEKDAFNKDANNLKIDLF